MSSWLLSAAEISSRTQLSSSTSARDDSAWKAAEASIRPSAQAAWPRTNGTGSMSAAARAGTASSDPQLPNATHAFRSSPFLPARVTGESANSRRNPLPESDNKRSANSMSGGPSNSDLGEYAGSEVGTENLLENGHTSWQMSHP